MKQIDFGWLLNNWDIIEKISFQPGRTDDWMGRLLVTLTTGKIAEKKFVSISQLSFFQANCFKCISVTIQ